jgi:hypothetical protein
LLPRVPLSTRVADTQRRCARASEAPLRVNFHFRIHCERSLDDSYVRVPRRKCSQYLKALRVGLYGNYVLGDLRCPKRGHPDPRADVQNDSVRVHTATKRLERVRLPLVFC